MQPGEKFGDLRISNPMGNMWVLLAWDGVFWRMLAQSFPKRDQLLEYAVRHGLYRAIVGDKQFTPWTNSNGARYQQRVIGHTLYTVCLDDEMVVASGGATCRAYPWIAPGVPTIGPIDD